MSQDVDDSSIDILRNEEALLRIEQLMNKLSDELVSPSATSKAKNGKSTGKKSQ